MHLLVTKHRHALRFSIVLTGRSFEKLLSTIGDKNGSLGYWNL